ncbi:MAG: ABC transporter substrate-binding protein [Rhodospirillaceae bacterium]|nr:ABC transporter substrate-binding protein [Rhodospirillaceae bacterium]
MKRFICGICVGVFIGLSGAAAESTLRMGVLGIPVTKGQPYASMNAPTIYTWAAIFDSLTFVGHDGAIRPWLALSWENVDPLTWRFDLRPGVTFSNGEPFNADAVVNAVDYLISPAAAGDVVASMFNTVVGARALDALTVEITTRTPNPVLPREVSTLRIVAPEAWRRLGPQGFGNAPHGTGPFQVERFEPARVVMRRFDNSWRPPAFDRLEVRAVPEGPARVQAMMSRQLDMILGASPDLMDALADNGDQVVVVPGSGTFAFSFILNPSHPAFGPANAPLTDVRVRQALNYAVDKNAFLTALLGGKTGAASQPAPPIAFGYDPALAPYPFDPEKARALLAEAGYPDGFAMVVEIVPGGSIPNGEAIYQKVAEDLAKVGVRVELRPFTIQQYLRALHFGEFSGQGFMMDFPSAPTMDVLRAMKLHSCWWKTPYLCVAEDQALIEEIAQEFDIERRLNLSRQLMRRYRDQAYALYLFNTVEFYGLRRGLTGFEAEGLFIRYDKIRDSGT